MEPLPPTSRRRRFRWWHGWLLGLLIGVAIWQLQGMFEGSGKPSATNGMAVQRFARLAPLNGDPATKARAFQDVRVHPAMDGKNLVTLRIPATENEPEQRVEVLAPIPFVVQPPTPRAAPRAMSPADVLAGVFGGRSVAPQPAPAPVPPVTYASVREFLAKAAPSLPVRYAWWEDETFRTAASLGGPFVLLGILLPFALQCLVWLGLLAPLPPPEPKPIPVIPEPPPKPKVDVDALVFANGQLNALTAEMEQNLDARSNEEPSMATPVVALFEPTPSSSHPAPPLEPVAPAAPVDPTTFDAGVYYPVHRPKRGEA